ncbi:MAG: hypothetical protein PUG71_08405 [bacterium]|nr:hypothetical protein [bacterium]
MKEKFMRFMSGRNGVDELNRFLLIVTLICYFVSIFTNWSILYSVAIVLLFYSYFRMFSRNLYKRSEENRTYLNKTAKLRYKWNAKISQLKQLRTHHIYKCPTCKQKIRVPRGKGRIEIRCPKCQSTFIKNS